jgi:hypothetical protein
MSIIDRAKRHDVPLRQALISGPRTAFLASVLAIGGTWLLAQALLPRDLVVPAVSTITFGLAAAIAGVAWWQQRAQSDDVTYWDVAGAVTLIGICTAALIGPEQMVRIVAGTPNEN